MFIVENLEDKLEVTHILSRIYEIHSNIFGNLFFYLMI